VEAGAALAVECAGGAPTPTGSEQPASASDDVAHASRHPKRSTVPAAATDRAEGVLGKGRMSLGTCSVGSKQLRSMEAPRASKRLGRISGGARWSMLAWLLGATALPSMAGCVPKSEHARVLADLQFSRNQAADLDGKLRAAQAEIARLQGEMAARDAKLDAANVAQADLIRKLDELAVLNAALQERLARAGQNVDQLVTEKGSLAQTLDDTRKQLEELRRQQAAAEARAAQFQDLLRRFGKLADAGKLRVIMRQGRMVIELPNDVLFDSGSAALKPEGRSTLLEVGKVFASMPERRFQVGGHTDNVKISNTRFPSNWELSTARAVSVVRLLLESGMKPENLSAAGYGEHDPAAVNDTAENKQKNRRIEITLVPDLEEFVKLKAAAPTG
jgi:chemotaxis protein MotB